MAIDFAMAAPEVISTAIYSGPGAIPMMAAATAYANLAAEVSTTATQWESIVSFLTTEMWTGGGSAAAAAAAQPIIDWLNQTAAALEQASAQATASAAAYETVFASVVPPSVVYANIAETNALIAANVAALGTLTPQINALEAEYAAFAVTDQTAVGVYQAAATAAAVLTPVTPLASTTDPAAAFTAGPLSALSDVSNGPIATTASQLLSGPSFQSTSFLQSIDGLLGTPSFEDAFNGAVNTTAWFIGNTIPTAVSLGHTLAGAAVPVAAVGDVTAADGAGVIEGTVVRAVTPAAGMGFGGAMTGSLGQATTVGSLSVPATWESAAPATASLASSTAPVEGSGWTAPVEEPAMMGAPGMPGMVAGAKGAGGFAGPRYGVKPIVMPKQVVV